MEGGILPIKKADGSPFRFIVTDDSQFMRKQVVRIIQQIGGEVVGEAENGEQAVQMYQQFQPDLVTMDITMPVMNGVEALTKIMEIDKNALVVMVTAIGHETIVKQSIMLGSKHFVVKPFKPTDVSQTLIAVLKKYLGGVQ